jgi:hypothetical protein
LGDKTVRKNLIDYCGMIAECRLTINEMKRRFVFFHTHVLHTDQLLTGIYLFYDCIARKAVCQRKTFGKPLFWGFPGGLKSVDLVGFMCEYTRLGFYGGGFRV